MRRRALLWSVLERYQPVGWATREKAPNVTAVGPTLGQVVWAKRIIEFPPLVNNTAMCVALHECAHVLLGHAPWSEFTFEEEAEAELFAYDKMRKHNLRIPRFIKVSSRLYLDGLFRGQDHDRAIDDALLRFIDSLPLDKHEEQIKRLSAIDWKAHERAIARLQ